MPGDMPCARPARAPPTSLRDFCGRAPLAREPAAAKVAAQRGFGVRRAGPPRAAAAPPPPPPPAALAGPDALAEALRLVTAAAASGAARVRRALLEPPPPGFPRGPRGDAALALLQDPLKFIDDATRAYGDVVGLLLGGERAVLVADPAVARQILIDGSGTDFVKAGTAFFPGSSLAGNGLLVSDGDAWRRQRQLAAPAFRRAAVDAYAPAMVRCAAAALLGERVEEGGGAASARPSAGSASSAAAARPTAWRPGTTRDVYPDFNVLTLAITLEALFGGGAGSGAESVGGEGGGAASSAAADLHAATGAELTTAIGAAFEHFARRGAAAFFLPEQVPTPDNLHFGAAVARLDAAVYGIIRRRRAELAARSGSAASGAAAAAEAPPPRDLLDALLSAADAAGAGMADAALRDELMTLLVAGQETSAIALAWTCAYLAHNPATQARAAAEVAAALGPGGGAPAPALARAGRLPFLEACALEALRLSPPAYLVGRCAPKGVVLNNGVVLPPGTTLLVSPYALQRDARRWGASAAEFRPERWLEPLEEAAADEGAGGLAGGTGTGTNTADTATNTAAAAPRRTLAAAALSGMGPRDAYIPFGAGPRVCVGAGFAMMEAVLVLALILSRFELAPPARGAPFPAAAPRITLRPAAVRLAIRRRRPAAAPAGGGAGGRGRSGRGCSGVRRAAPSLSSAL
jgi:cytochrome P450